MRKRRAMTLTELTIAAVIGVVLITAAALILVWLARMHTYFSHRSSQNMSWIAANEDLKKRVHSSSYVKIPDDDTLELYDYDDNSKRKKGTYTSTAGADPSLTFDHVAPGTGAVIVFENVSAAFSRVYPATGDDITEVRIDYTSPSQLASPLILKCGVDHADTWAFTYGLDYIGQEIHGYAAARGLDGEGYILTGGIRGETSLTPHIYLIKTDDSGFPLWTKEIAYASYAIEGKSVQPTDNIDGKGYIVAGTVDRGTTLLHDIYLDRRDGNGTVVSGWPKIIDNIGNNYADAIKQTDDGGYIIAGRINPPVTPYVGDQALLTKTNHEGSQESGWPRLYGGNANDVAKSVCQTHNSSGNADGYILAGYANYDPTVIPVVSPDIYIVRTDLDGNELWSEVIASSVSDEAYSVIQDSDLNFVVTGRYNNDACLIKLADVRDISGNVTGGTIVWNKPFYYYAGSAQETGYSVQETYDHGGYIISGSSTSFLGGSENKGVYLFKTNHDGFRLWQEMLGTEKDDYGYAVIAVPDGYVVGGTTYKFSQRGSMYLLKTDSKGKCPESSSPDHYNAIPS
jgi:hypothetical protein